MTERKPRAYVDRGKPGGLRYRGDVLLTVRDPLPVPVRRLALEIIRRHNSLDPELLPTERVLLRWGENLGTGIPNPNADMRETHYDPLPPDLHKKVDVIVERSPWCLFLRKWYLTTLDTRALARELGCGETKLKRDRVAALWYCRGRFEGDRITG